MVTADSPSIGNLSAKNLHEILQKLSVDERIKPHEFWDSQPVPKLRESVTLLCGSLVPRPCTPPVFDRLQYAKTEGEGLGNFIM